MSDTTQPARRRKDGPAQCKMLPATATKAELVAAHRAKMKRKAGARPDSGFTPISGKRTDAMVLHAKLNGRTNFFPADRARFDRMATSTPASINRHTGKPHEHKRAIARSLARVR